MKKILPLLLFALIIFTACKTGSASATADSTGAGTSFEYEAMTRGSFKKVIVTRDSVVTIMDRDMKEVITKKLSSADWNALLKDTKTIDLANILNLKSPTNKRQYDGALIGSLKVIKGGTTYQSSGFDHGAPPVEIEALVNRIIAVSDLQKK